MPCVSERQEIACTIWLRVRPWKTTGAGAADRIMYKLYGEAERLQHAVNAIPATTEAGLRTKVLVACLTNEWLLTRKPEELQYGDREVLDLVMNMFALLGMSFEEDVAAWRRAATGA